MDPIMLLIVFVVGTGAGALISKNIIFAFVLGIICVGVAAGLITIGVNWEMLIPKLW